MGQTYMGHPYMIDPYMDDPCMGEPYMDEPYMDDPYISLRTRCLKKYGRKTQICRKNANLVRKMRISPKTKNGRFFPRNNVCAQLRESTLNVVLLNKNFSSSFIISQNDFQASNDENNILQVLKTIDFHCVCSANAKT